MLHLSSLTGWSRSECIGNLHILWWWTLKYAEDGDIGKYDPSQSMALICGKLSPEKTYELLKKTNFIEENGIIHDWLDYAGRYLEGKYRTSNPKKWKEIQQKNKTRFRQPKVTLKTDNQPNLTNLTNQPNHITEQVKILFDSFGEELKEKVNVYLVRVATKNKSGVITEGRKITLLNELFNCRENCKNDKMFSYAVDQAVNRDACNIGYINAIIKNKKTEKPKESFAYHVPARTP